MKGLDEKWFKSCTKGKVKFTAGTFVKFLIMGTMALSLTACGGGGGGGSSSGGSSTITKFPGVDNIVAHENIENEKDKIFDENIISDNSKVGYTGLKVSNNSDVVIKQGRNIEISGKGGITGVLASGNSKVTNEGTIKVYTDYLHEDEIGEDTTIEDTIKYMSKGIFVTDNSTGINKGTIELKGSAVGILAYGKGSVGINEEGGTIKIVSDRGSDWEEAPTMGMASIYGGKAVNNGEISGSVSGQMGMFSHRGELVNNGTINLSADDSYGMVVQRGTIENGENGKIILSHGNSYGDYTNEAVEVEGGKGINKGLIEVENKYSYYPESNENIFKYDDFDNDADVGMYGGNGAELINEKTGTIEISGSTAGMMIDGEYGEKSSAVNNGKIIVFSNEKPDNSNEYLVPTVAMGVEDGGKIENNNLITGNGVYVIGMAGIVEEKSKYAVNTVTNNGRIELSGSDLHGMENLTGKNGNLTNNDTIKLSGSGLYGIQGVGNITNNGLIHLTIEKIDENNYMSVGMDLWEVNAVNGEKGQIIIENKTNEYVEGVAIDEDGGKFVNKGLIEIVGGYGAGVDTGVVPEDQSGERPDWQEKAEAINEKRGVITVIGTNSSGNNMYGMAADGSKASITNKGTINVEGENSWGMAAFGGAKAENHGVINVGDKAAGGMLASGEGSTIANYETINISKNNKNGAEGMKAEDGGKILNKGTINTDADVEIKTSGKYVIGTNEDGTYGKLFAANTNIDGEVVVETKIARGNYKKEHILQNVVESESIKIGESANFKSDSVLYTASAEKDVFGNLDAKLERNDKNISDFADSKFTTVSSIFDSYINSEDEYKKLSAEEQEVVDTIFDNSTSEKSLKNAVDKVAGTEYLNVQRQIFDIKNTFREYDKSVISTLDTYDFNFQFIGEYSDISSKDGVSGYENKMTGFNGAVKLSENLYGVLGYGYSDIDYDGNSDGKIQTIHTGIYKNLSVEKYNMRLGMYGEYNFHENNRAVFTERAESEFNSYLAGVSGEISRKYGKDLYIKPTVSLDIAYGNIENFDEEKAHGFNLKVDEQSYTSVLPKAELVLGKDFENSKVFASAGYSYELGDMDKDMTIELLNRKADVKNNEMEHGQFDISVGGSIDINDLSLNAEIGKNFGRRDREYVKAGFSYKF